MARTCSLCRHERRAEIDAALMAGLSNRTISKQFEITDSAVQRHRSHLPRALAPANRAAEVTRADSLLEKLAEIESAARRIAAQAEAAEDHRSAIAAIRELIRLAELLARLRGELKAGATVEVSVIQNADWPLVRDAIVRALEPYPDARLAVARALEALRAA